ncbi:MAG: polyprenyl diphosphate synthase [Myxococcota bacterium]|nr:polyprenyl diphosphate synthase [Myxococcota bacterium]
MGSPPRHIAIIMDGNGRWAERRGLPRIEGHRQGAESVRQVTRAARAIGIGRLTLYAFSEQNWGRPLAEVAALMQLLRDYLTDERAEIMDNNIRLTTLGNTERLPEYVKGPLDKLMTDSSENDGMELCLALSYGGREEITAAVQRIAERVASGDLDPSAINPSLLQDTIAVEDVDLIIRTSGEQRLSNFLLWQSAYAELYFADCLWPEFGKAELLEALSAFQRRARRFGLVA